MGIFGGSAQDDVDLRALTERVSRLEATVAALQAQLLASPVPAGTPAAADTGWLAEVRALRDGGKAIAAIKLYRERTGVGLKEAKDAVERMP